jgi:hypothetical protein
MAANGGGEYNEVEHVGKTGVVENGYTDADGQTKPYQLNDGGTITELEYGKESTTKGDAANAEPDKTAKVVDKINDGLGIPQATIAAMAEKFIGKEEVIKTAKDGTIEFADQFKNMGQAGNKLLNAVEKIGMVGGVIDAVSSWTEYANNKTTGNFLKATTKTFLAVLKVNPIVNLITSAADLTGATDWAFRQLD